MIFLIRNELGKLFKMNLVKIIFVSAFIFALLSLLSNKATSAYYIPLSVLSNLTKSLVIVCLCGFTGYIYGIEIQSKTLKIIKSKNIKPYKFLLIKYIASIISIIIFIAFIGVSIFFISILKYPLDGFTMDKMQIFIPKDQGLQTVIYSYALEIIPVCFIAFICITLTICFNSSMLGIGGTIAIYILSTLLESIKFIKVLLPSYHLTIWSQFIENKGIGYILLEMLIILVYNIILYLIAVNKFKRLEVY